MDNKKNSLYDHKRNQMLFRALSFLVAVMVVLVFAIGGLVIYIAFATSIDKSLVPSEEINITNIPTRSAAESADPNRVVNGLHVATGMVYDENFDLVRGACTTCHSSKLIIQNRATRDGWKQMISWMQATQGLQDLGTYEPRILDYLEEHYAPTEEGRRMNLALSESDWYRLKS